MALQISRTLRSLRDVTWLRSSLYFIRALIAAVGDTRTRSRAKLDQLHSTSSDVWHYSTIGKSGKQRFLREASMLDRARGNHLIHRAIEIGCHEGAFTEFLAARCDNVLALDFSPVVLERARTRRDWPNVDFQEFDLRTDALSGEFDLIVIASVFETFYRAANIHAAREKLVARLPPGGYLLVGNVRGNEVFESATWAKWLIRGGVRISEFFAADRRLTLIAREMDDLYVDALFLRHDGESPGGLAPR